MSDDNPYAPPASDLESHSADPARSERGAPRIASQGKRFMNFLIDGICHYVVAILLGVVLAVTDLLYLTEGSIGILLSVASWFSYYFLQEAIFGRTIGKLVTGTRVVDMDGNRPTFPQYLGRTFARLIPFEAFSFFGGGGFPVGWHDSLSKTRVVSAQNSATR